MLESLLAKYGLELVFGLISTGALAACRYFWKQNKEFGRLQKEEDNRKYRQMIIDEIEPIIEELGRAEEEIKKVKNQSKIKMADMTAEELAQHEKMYEDLNKLQEENERKFALILNSYKFRLIQLCKTHIKDNYITQKDYDQISEMHTLYVGLGGNGQAEEYYQKVKKLDIKDPDKK